MMDGVEILPCGRQGTHQSCMANTMAAGGLAMWGARASAAMVLTQSMCWARVSEAIVLTQFCFHHQKHFLSLIF